MAEAEEPRCLCEYVDIGVGLQLAAPDPECPIHTPDVLTAMTYRRHTMEASVDVTPVRTHWAHSECSCGCEDPGESGG